MDDDGGREFRKTAKAYRQIIKLVAEERGTLKPEQLQKLARRRETFVRLERLQQELPAGYEIPTDVRGYLAEGCPSEEKVDQVKTREKAIKPWPTHISLEVCRGLSGDIKVFHDIELHMTVLEFKNCIGKKCDVPAKMQKLLFDANVLENSEALVQYYPGPGMPFRLNLLVSLEEIFCDLGSVKAGDKKRALRFLLYDSYGNHNHKLQEHLRQLGDNSLVQAVLGCCDDRAEDVAILATDVVCRIAHRGDPEVVRKVLGFVQEEGDRFSLRTNATFDLGLIAESNDDRVVATLLDLLHHNVSFFRVAAIAALTNVTTCATNQSVRTALENCLINDCNPAVTSNANRALAGQVLRR